MGVKPTKVVDLKGLMGDPSDNYPGVAGIGPKTAISLLEQFGSIPNLYEHLDKIKNQRVVEKLRTSRDNAFLSRELATVKTDVPLTFNVADAKCRDLATEAVIKLFGELEFKTLLKRLLQLSGKQQELAVKVIAEVKKDDQLGLF
jgi:DNA polymerase-1